jgi:hypothetical protein
MKKYLLLWSILYTSSAFSLTGTTLYQYGLEFNKHYQGLSNNPYYVGEYRGYIDGALETTIVAQVHAGTKPLTDCLPSTVPNVQTYKIVFNYLDDNPKNLIVMHQYL